MFLATQVAAQSRLREVTDQLRDRLETDSDRGEVTAGTIMIVVLCVAALAAGGAIAVKINANANAVPSP
jgi:hypothetical protein